MFFPPLSNLPSRPLLPCCRWVAAGEQEDAEMEDAEAKAKAKQREKQQQRRRQQEQEMKKEEKEEDEGLTGQARVGKGLASVLGLLKDKGTLQEKQLWAGRNSDKSKVALQVRKKGGA